MKPDYIIRLPPVPKKNGSRILKRRNGQRFVAPSERYEQYSQAARWFL